VAACSRVKWGKILVSDERRKVEIAHRSGTLRETAVGKTGRKVSVEERSSSAMFGMIRCQGEQ